MGEFVRLDVDDGVAVIRLDRPPANAIDLQLGLELQEAIAEADARVDVGALVVWGGPRLFAAGADIKAMATWTSEEVAPTVEALGAACDLLEASPKISIAAVTGYALGGGLELALACDLRVAARDARLGVPEMKLGLLPGAGATQRLPRLLPVPIAKQLVLTGEPLSGQRAYELGLVNEVTDGADVLTRATALAKVLAAGAPQALAAGKHLVDDGVAMSLDAAIHLERETVAGLFATEDRRIGVQAFRNRTAPVFIGR
jgi:enoyl-CoA hydratase